MKKILLNGELNSNNNIDTDGETLIDWEEVDTTRLIWNKDGSFDIPTLDMAEIIALFRRFDGADYSFLIYESPRRFLPIFPIQQKKIQTEIVY